ncbi:MAG: hypothetical protein R3217_03570 [Gammaproteobacteria bacterium]|nr:hypothetical protein [Gammaproteobacteria bacterium]
MLGMIRQQGHALHGSLAALLLASLLLTALAPCLAMAHDEPAAMSPAHMDPASMNMGHAMHDMDMSSMASMEACPHCDSVDSSCVDAMQDCSEQPAALLGTPDIELSPAVPVEAVTPPVAALRELPVPATRSPPCPPSGRDLHVLICSFQE